MASAVADASNQLNVLTMGHSFVRRLRDWSFDNEKLNLNLDRNRVSVFWHGVGGGIVVRPRSKCAEMKQGRYRTMACKLLWNDMHLISDLDIQLVILEIGTNDLSRPNACPAEISSEIVEFINECFRCGASYIVVCEVLYRQGRQSFNTKVDALNEELELVSRAQSNVYFWRHSLNNFNVRFLQDYVASDGIHVDRVKGMARYYSSIRGALILGENAFLRR